MVIISESDIDFVICYQLEFHGSSSESSLFFYHNPRLILFHMTSNFNPKSVLEIDPWLVDNVGAIGYRYQLFKKRKDTIKEVYGGYDQFTKGYLKFGFNVTSDGSVVYREWAPNAKEAVLTGDFSACF